MGIRAGARTSYSGRESFLPHLWSVEARNPSAETPFSRSKVDFANRPREHKNKNCAWRLIGQSRNVIVGRYSRERYAVTLPVTQSLTAAAAERLGLKLAAYWIQFESLGHRPVSFDKSASFRTVLQTPGSHRECTSFFDPPSVRSIPRTYSNTTPHLHGHGGDFARHVRRQ